MASRVVLTDIDGAAFQHPLDKESTQNLKRLAGFDRLVAKFLELRYERLLYLYNIASSVRVGPRQFPRLYEMLRESCNVLDVPEPELYVSQQPVVNAYTFGHTRPYIVLYTRLIDLLSDDEVHAAIAHEVGHIKCGHVLYYTMANSIRDVIAIVSQLTLGIGRIVGASIEATLMEWRRRAELSADRAALLAVQNMAPCLSMLTKLAGGTDRMAAELSPEEFLAQARMYNERDENDLLDNFYRTIAEFSQGNHPFTVERVKELDEWARGPEYTGILAGNYTRIVKKVQIKVQKH